MKPSALLDRAEAALPEAHAPYSEYAVGAALETADGTVVQGCNIEFANFSNTLHAEEVALGQAVSRGHTEFAALAVASAAQDGVTPCGMCRQSLIEFCDGRFPIYCGTTEEFTTHRLGDLLPAAIGADDLE